MHGAVFIDTRYLEQYTTVLHSRVRYVPTATFLRMFCISKDVKDDHALWVNE